MTATGSVISTPRPYASRPGPPSLPTTRATSTERMPSTWRRTPGSAAPAYRRRSSRSAVAPSSAVASTSP